MLEEIAWFLAWIVLLYGVNYQFKVCVPVTIFCLKIAESFLLLFLVKLFFFFQVHGEGMNLQNMTWELYNYTKVHMSKLDL
jgi:hypothetical protein